MKCVFLLKLSECNTPPTRLAIPMSQRDKSSVFTKVHLVVWGASAAASHHLPTVGTRQVVSRVLPNTQPLAKTLRKGAKKVDVAQRLTVETIGTQYVDLPKLNLAESYVTLTYQPLITRQIQARFKQVHAALCC